MRITQSKKSFGQVNKGDLVKLVYDFRNEGDQALLIFEAEVSCSCTTVQFPKQPILPGQSEKITLIFNTTTVYGRQDRLVYLKTNDSQVEHKLRYKGTVSKK